MRNGWSRSRRLSLGDTDRAYLSYPNFADLRAAATSFELLEGATVSRLVVQTREGSERLRGETVTPGFFELLGVRPELGRTFTADEYAGTPSAPSSSRAGSGGRVSGLIPECLGQAISTRVGPAVVVGILPESYLGISEDDGTDYWLAEKQNNHPDMLTDRATDHDARRRPAQTGRDARAGGERSEVDLARPGCGASRGQRETRGKARSARANAGANRCAAGCSRCWSVPVFSFSSVAATSRFFCSRVWSIANASSRFASPLAPAAARSCG